MFKTVVVGTDGSDNASKAVKAAADMVAGDSDATLHIVTAFRPLTPAELLALAEQLPDEFRSQVSAQSGVESRLESAKHLAQVRGAKHVEIHQIDAEPTEAILDKIKAVDADLLVVGSRGEGFAGRIMHGSVSTKLLHHAPCSVMVVKA